MTKYLFILKPLKPFFFGGEKSSFDKTDYFMESRYFPQQTSALGLVREYILDISGFLGKTRMNKTDCDKFIGKNSFNGEFNQGVINSLSPVQIVQTTEINSKIQVNNALYLTKFDLNRLDTIKINGNINYGIDKEKSTINIELIKNGDKIFDGKDYGFIENKFISVNSDKPMSVLAKYNESLLIKFGFKRINTDGVFIRNIKPGNTKNYLGNSKENKDGYYKQINYDLNKGYAFAFEVDIEDNIFKNDLTVFNKMTRFGGRASSFSLTIVKNNTVPKLTVNPNGNKLLLLSDAIVDNSVYEHVTACVTDTNTLRYALTSNSEAIYNKRLNRDFTRARQYGSERKCLLSRGTVLLSNNVTNTLKKFDEEHFIKLGYNQTIQQ